jgi:hypothetical protein
LLNRRVSIAILFVVFVGGLFAFPSRVTGVTSDSVMICVYCEGDWAGSYGAGFDIHQISGNTSTTYQFNRTSPTYGWAPTAMVSKTSTGNYNLTLTIETLARAVLERASTTAEFGEVTVVWSEEPIPIPGFPWPAIVIALIGAVAFFLKRR